MESETIDSLRVHVRRGLDRFCLGQYFTEYGLQETVKLIPDNVNTDDLEASGLMDKKCAFQVFLKAVASEIVKEKGVTKGRKKRIKDYLEILQAFSSEWVDYIRKNMRKKQQAKMNKSSLGSPDPSGGDSGGTPHKKKGGKRGPRGPYKKRKQAAAAASSPALTAPSPSKRKKLPPADIATARREFEAEKEDVMSKVPGKNKKLFSQVGFAKWGKSNLPAMALDPYSVPPGDIREQWMKMFQNVVHKDRIGKMGHLVWWIGPQTDGQSSYSVVPCHGFMAYEEGEKKNMHELPSKIKRLLDKGSELNKTQMEQVEALRILNELALQPKEEREHPRSDFMEEDYWGLDDEGAVEEEAPEAAVEEETVDDKDDEDEELLDDEEDLIDSSFEGKKTKKKKGKKRKKEDIIIEEEEEDHTEIVYDEIEEATPVEPPKKKKKKDKAKGKKKKKQDEEAEDAGNQSAGVDEDEVMDDASAASADSALADSDYGGDEFGDTDEQATDDAGASSKKKDKKLKKKGNKAKSSKQDASKDDKKGKKKKKSKDKNEGPKRRTNAQEQRDLEMCEEEYLPFVEKLQTAKEKKDIDAIQGVLKELLPVAELFTASFFSEYEIPKIMKQTKTVLEEAGSDITKYRNLWQKMKSSYQVKVKEMPEGFKAVKGKKKSSKAAAKDSSERGSEDEPSENATAIKEEDTKSQGSPTRPSEADAPDVAESADVATSPPMKVPVKEGKRRASWGSETLKSVEKTPAAKPKPKKFSVMDFMSKKKDNKQRHSTGGGLEKSSTTPSSGVLNKKTVPSWVTAPLPTSFDSFIGCERREDRVFALEFLLQAAAHFPSNKGVNEESVARSMEMAIYDWSQSQRGSWTDVYWDKVHAIVAAVTGKRDVGTLVDMIMEGSFSSPKSLMKLSVEDLEHSFEGRPFVLSGE